MEKTDIRAFYDLFIYTRKRLCLPPIPLAVFDSIIRSVGREKIELIFALLDNQPIAGLLALKFNGRLHIEYTGGNNRAYQNGASHLLHWEAIRRAWASGCTTVSFGRTELWNKGLTDFKRRWATVEEPINTYWLAVNSKHVNPTYVSAKRSNLSRFVFGYSPQPVRKALASFIYHHHG
jgi:hypothetical protein